MWRSHQQLPSASSGKEAQGRIQGSAASRGAPGRVAVEFETPTPKGEAGGELQKPL